MSAAVAVSGPAVRRAVVRRKSGEAANSRKRILNPSTSGLHDAHACLVSYFLGHHAGSTALADTTRRIYNGNRQPIVLCPLLLRRPLCGVWWLVVPQATSFPAAEPNRALQTYDRESNYFKELRKDNPNDEMMARRKLATTIVALAAIGETDPAKLKHFALHATRAAGLGMKPAVRKTARKSAVAHSI